MEWRSAAHRSRFPSMFLSRGSGYRRLALGVLNSARAQTKLRKEHPVRGIEALLSGWDRAGDVFGTSGELKTVSRVASLFLKSGAGVSAG